MPKDRNFTCYITGNQCSNPLCKPDKCRLWIEEEEAKSAARFEYEHRKKLAQDLKDLIGDGP